MDRPARVEVRHDVRERGGRRRRARRGRVCRSRHLRHRDLERRGARPDREPAPHVPVRRRGRGAHWHEPPRGGVRPAGGGGATAASRSRRPAQCIRSAVQHGAQDGRQLRMGLGPAPADRRHLAGGASRAVAAGAPRRGSCARHGAHGGAAPGRARRRDRRRRAGGGASCRRPVAAGRPAGARPGPQPRRPRGGHPGRPVVAGNRDRRGGRRPTLVADRARRATAVRRHRVVGVRRRAGRPGGPSGGLPRRGARHHARW